MSLGGELDVNRLISHWTITHSSSSPLSSSLPPPLPLFTPNLLQSGPVFSPWKLNTTMFGHDVVFNGQKFDLVVVATVLHDVLALTTPNDFRKTLSEGGKRGNVE